LNLRFTIYDLRFTIKNPNRKAILIQVIYLIQTIACLEFTIKNPNRKSKIVNREGFVNEQEFKDRTKKLGLRVIRLVEALPKSQSAQVIGRQILRAATSVGANYRAACRAKSAADILNKLKIVEEEADETLYWLELLVEAELIPETRLKDLMTETNEIIAMTVSSIKTLRERQNNRKS
jgi:four helix bundle protein